VLVFMGRVSLVAGCQQVFDFASTASLVDSGEKQGMNPQISQLMCCGLYQEPFFSGAVALLNSVDDYKKYAIYEPREIRMVFDHTRTEHGKRVTYWSDFPLQRVHRFESPRLSDMSIACL
jgi:hypothetical protein